MDSHRRSIAKGITWRVLAMADTVALALIFTGSIGTALSIGGLELLTKTLWYYLHERLWQLIPYGDPATFVARWLDRGTRSRSVVKAFSWRVFGTADTFLLSWLLTGKALVGGSIGGSELITKVVLYYLHERAWAHIRWGRIPHPDDGFFLEIVHRIEGHDPTHPHRPLVALAYMVAAFFFVLLSALIAYALVHARTLLGI